MSLFVILLGGDLTVTARLQARIAGARVIGADSGIRHAAALGVTPELWVGDMDSVDEIDAERWKGVPVEPHPADKDLTDGELAAEAALARGATALVFIGAFGGPRADHAFLHLTAAIRLAERGVAVVLSSGGEEGAPLRQGENRFDLPQGALFSVLPFSDLAGLSIAGARWPLTRRDVPFGSSLTLSNIVDGELVVTLREGRAVLVASLEA